MGANPKAIVVYTDFDGTISTNDLGVLLIDAHMGMARRRDLDAQILMGTISFRDAVAEMWASVTVTWEEAMAFLRGQELDPDFAGFVEFCDQRDVPITVLSAGLEVPLHATPG